ncbi:TBC-domain-containing protein [Laetiporus sulphureus 93-53]|uniref:TBC-domain-containing protein n=1 Tax=Laetiporus sulphureus 93-53 TaxID=1314785 RepID=A0A165CC25_9APHY|nr:TBC-domain-containing protein [Laetiporus sulphureus 93-53]KZT02541.1 TBC-domain-containing protein [Laetiporus sulphureus 93-53]
MTSAPPPQVSTPTHTHPLLLDEALSRGRKLRSTQLSEDRKPSVDYFSLKAQVEHSIEEHAGYNSDSWDGSVRGFGNGGRRKTGKPAPLIVVESSSGNLVPSVSSTDNGPDAEFAVDADSGSAADARILQTKWHEMPGDAIEDAVSKYRDTTPQSSIPSHPYHSVLRVLSSAVHKLSRMHRELEETRRLLQEKETARRERAEHLLKELPPSEKVVAERILQSLFPNDDEEHHQVERRHSETSLTQSLTEAIEEDVSLSTNVPLELNTPLAPILAPMDMDASVATLQADSDRLQNSEPSLNPSTVNVLIDSTQIVASPYEDATNGPDDSLKSDRVLFGDWMGAWWAKNKKNNGGASLTLDDDASASIRSSPSRTVSSQNLADDIAAAQSVPQTPKTSRRKAARSVFGSLGLSILNPSTSSFSSRKRRNLSVTDIHAFAASADPKESKRETKSVCSAASSPVRGDLPSHPSGSSQVSEVASSSKPPSLSTDPCSTADEKPPQGTSLRAIIQATRVMTSDPSSILDDQGHETSTFIAEKAMELVRNAREEGLELRERPKEKREHRPERSEGHGQNMISPAGELTPFLAHLSPSESGQRPSDRRKPSVNFTSFASPLFGSFMAQQGKAVSVVVGSVQRGYPSAQSSQSIAPSGGPSQQVAANRPGSVPLESIIPVDAKPPTHYLSRTYTPLTSRDFHFSIPLPDAASALSVPYDELSHEGVTDRYGFIYDVSKYDALLLVRAKECGNTAPACLTGIKIADRKEDNSWPEDEGHLDDNIEIVKEACECDGVDEMADTMSIKSSGTRRTSHSLPTADSGPNSSQPSRGTSPSSTKARKRAGTLHGKPARLLTSILSVDEDTPRHVCAKTIRQLIAQLVEVHDEREAAQRKEWDTFLKHRRASRKSSGGSSSRTPNVGGGGAAAILGLGTEVGEEELEHSGGLVGFAQLGLPAYRDERKEFVRLVRHGIPLVYRSKAWLECSGGLDMREPGIFTDLLAQSDDESGVVREIEKDVCRTMPLNVFFGRTGAGVDKLRRVLTAYSRRNPSVGYCQGMNLVTSTLLLIHADEEEAFWVLSAIIERILPPDFFSPSLLSSRACPLVLQDYVQEHIPKLYHHLTELGVDLPAICFSWFLSLFTDCLPIETLFRVWDIFLVDGLDVLFRIAFGILRMNEQELLHCGSIPAVYVALESLPNRMWETDKLLQVCMCGVFT